MKTYEDAVTEFNASEDAKAKALLDEHDGCHCPLGQHVWQPCMVVQMRKCAVCGVLEDYGMRVWSCRHCGPIAYDPDERRANELRKFLWEGQKNGTIAAPMRKPSLMSFLWDRAK